MPVQTRSMVETRRPRRDLGRDERYQDLELDMRRNEEDRWEDSDSDNIKLEEDDDQPEQPEQREVREVSPLNQPWPDMSEYYQPYPNSSSPPRGSVRNPVPFSFARVEECDSENDRSTIAGDEPEVLGEETWGPDDGHENITDEDAEGFTDVDEEEPGASGSRDTSRLWDPENMPKAWKDIPGPPDGYIPPNIDAGFAPQGAQFIDPLPWRRSPNRTNLPQEFHNASGKPASPLEYFRLFFSDSIFAFLSEKTNSYAKHTRSKHARSERQRPWEEVDREELKTWIGIHLYLAFLNTKLPDMAWQETTRVRFIADYMPKTRFEQIRRYFHVYGPSESTNHLRKNDPLRKPWYFRFEPLMDFLRPKFKEFFKPGTCGAVDEMMIKFMGRSHHTIRIERKPIKEGYKVISICFEGYLWDFVWWSPSGTEKSKVGPGSVSAKLVRDYKLSGTAQAVALLCQTLPSRSLEGDDRFVIFMDNFFSGIRLFRYLRLDLGIGAVATVRPGRRNSEFPTTLGELQKISTSERNHRFEWNWLQVVGVKDGVLCFAWLDNAWVFGMTTVHSSPKSLDDYIFRPRCQPRKTSGNAQLVRAVFGKSSRRWLPIPVIIDDYNHEMNAVDMADQARSIMPSHRRGLRSWFSIFFWILDCCVANAWKLYNLHCDELGLGRGERLTHRVWMHMLAIGLITEGFQRRLGHIPPTMKVTNIGSLLDKNASFYFQFVSRMRQLHPNVYLSPLRFDKSLLHIRADLGLGRRSCKWCTFKAGRTRVIRSVTLGDSSSAQGSVDVDKRYFFEHLTGTEMNIAGLLPVGNLRVELGRVPATPLGCYTCKESLCIACFDAFHTS